MAEEVLKLLQFINTKCHPRSSRGSSASGLDSRLRGNDIILFDHWEKYSVAQAFKKFAKITEKELFDEKLFFNKALKKGYNIKNATYEEIFSQLLATEIEPKLGVKGYSTLLYDYPKQMASLAKLNDDGKTAQRCEFYINGLEVGGFCTELNDYQEQQKRFISEANKRKQNKMINHTIDKGFIEALKYGLPFCTGAGIGFERLAMIFAGIKSIDELKLINIS